MSYSRFAIYFVPPDGPLAMFGAEWLGWDLARGRPVRQPGLPGLRDTTAAPRKYGFHGTLKPPFRLKDGFSQDELQSAVAALGKVLAPATCDGLDLADLGGFLALTPHGDTAGLRQIAAACVSGLDSFRAPLTEAERKRRRSAGLSARQEAMLMQWGYPFVMDEFRFHLTLTGKLQADALDHWSGELRRRLPDLPSPFVLDQIALCGERSDGRFELIHRYTLAG